MKKAFSIVALAVVLVFVLLGITACSATDVTQTAKNDVVVIKNLSFTPATLTIAVGATVNWVNEESILHTITSDTGLFDSGPVAKDQSYSFTFNEKGTFAYHCSLHFGMTGTVIVQ